MKLCTVGPHAVRTGQVVYVNDSDLLLAPVGDKSEVDRDTKTPRHPDIQLRFRIEIVDPMFQVQTGVVDGPSEAHITAHTSFFGADLTANPIPDSKPIRFGHGAGVRLTRDPANILGCSPYEHAFNGDALLVHRGECSFLDKLMIAKSAGASGVVVISDEELSINPSSDPLTIATVGDISDVALVALKRSAGEVVSAMLDSAEGIGQVVLMVDPEGQSATTDGRQVPPEEAPQKGGKEPVDPDRVLFINGHALLNTRLIV